MAYLSYLKHSDNKARWAQLSVGDASLSPAPPQEYDGFPASNAVVLPVAKTCRIWNRYNSGGSILFNVIMPTGVAASLGIQTIAFLNHNLTPTASIAIRGSLTGIPATTLLRNWTPTERNAMTLFTTGQNYRYWTFEITDEANPYGFFELGYLAMGSATDLTVGFLYDWKITDTEVSQRSENEVQSAIVGRMASQQEYEFRFEGLTESEMDEIRTPFLDSMQDVEPVVFMPDGAAGEKVLLGRFASDFQRKFGPGPRLSSRVSVVEDLPGVPTLPALPILRVGEDLPSGFTHTRTSVAYYKDKDLALVQAASGEYRKESFWDYGLSYILLEPQRINYWDYSSDLSNAAYAKASCTITSSATWGPIQVQGWDKLVEASDTDQWHYVKRNLYTCADNTDQPISFFVKSAQRTKCWIAFYDKAGAAVSSYFDMSTGTFNGNSLGVTAERYVDGWWRLSFSADSSSGAATPYILVGTANDSWLGHYNGDGVSGMYLGGFQHEVNAVTVTSYIPTTTGTVQRDADILEFAWTEQWQPMTAFIDLIEIGADYTSQRLAQLGFDGTNVNPRWIPFYTTGTKYILHYIGMNATDANSKSGPAGDLGERGEFLSRLYPDASVDFGYSVEGAADYITTQSAATGWDADPAYGMTPDVLGISQTPAVGSHAQMLFKSLKFYRGVQSFDFMRRL